MYRAGLSGFGAADRDPEWYCACEQWRRRAVPRNNADGNNKRQVAREYAAHVADSHESE